MPSIQSQLDAAFRNAIKAAFNLDSDPILAVSQNDKFGDYQSNAAMGLAKQASSNPRQVAEQIVGKLLLGEMAQEVTIAGPGFINVRLSPIFLAQQLQLTLADPRLGLPLASSRQIVVVDYSAPNIAKQMHVGHLRSTIIGDAIARVIAFKGDDVIRQNHLGDWGTQFGRVVMAMWYEAVFQRAGEHGTLDSLIERQRKTANADIGPLVQEVAALHQQFINEDPDGTRYFVPYLNEGKLDLDELENAYAFVSAITDNEHAEKAIVHHPIHGDYPLAGLPRLITTFIQNPNSKENLQERLAWEKAREVTLDTCAAIYRRLGVQLADRSIQSEPLERGESFYNPYLPEVVSELKEKQIAVESQSAVAVFIDGPDKTPLIIQKSDGGYLYGTTDLAAIRFRVHDLHANRIIYTHDSRQAKHFSQVFRTAQKAGWTRGEEVKLEYAPFGTMLGEDGKPFKSRSGDTIKLRELLDEAEERGYELAKQKDAERVAKAAEKGDAVAPMSEPQLRAIGKAVGIGGVKYADLSKDRISDYLFSFDAMLSLDGNTAPYLQYAHARVKAIFRKAGATPSGGTIKLESPYETALAKHVLRLGEIIDLVARELKPHHLTAYLYELSTKFSSFYENCPVIQSEEPTRTSRLLLCDVTAKTLALGLDLLGIEHPEQM